MNCIKNICLVLFVSTTLYAQQQPVDEKIKQVESNLVSWAKVEGSPNWTIEERMKYYGINALSVAVVHNYKIDWTKAYGWADTAEHRRATTETMFQAGSISKSLNAMGVLKLYQEKKVDLNSDVNNYLTSWKFPYDEKAKGKKITLAQLLSHTAGLNLEEGFGGYLQGKPIPTMVQILDGKKPANSRAIRSEFEPGLKYQYSGGGTLISQLVVMDVSKHPYDTYMYLNVFEPLGMSNSFFTQPPQRFKHEQLATAYYDKGHKTKFRIYPEQAAAGLWTTPTDLCKYIIETQLAAEGKSAKVLSAETTRLRLTPYIDSIAPTIAEGFGVSIVKKGDEKYFLHGGGLAGSSSMFWGSLKNGNGVVVMCNSDNRGIITEVVNSVAHVYDWKNFNQPDIMKLQTVAATILQKYIGTYKLQGNKVEIKKTAAGLSLQLNAMPQQMYFINDSTFFTYEDYKTEYTFIKDSNGKVTGCEKKSHFPKLEVVVAKKVK
jgi:CubicO group peptidase (beta-lactamase class C family)